MSNSMPKPGPMSSGIAPDGLPIVVTNAVLVGVGIALVVLRMVARLTKRMSLGIDDYLIIAAMIVTAGGSATYIWAAAAAGLGHHVNAISMKTALNFYKFSFAGQFPYIISMTLIKLSILLFYKRIFSTPRFRLAVHIVCGFVVAWFVTFFLGTLLQRLPISANWTITKTPNPNVRTINSSAMFVSSAVIALALDIVTLALPLFVIWRLQMKPSQKVFISGVFMLGAFVCVAAAMRLYYITLGLNRKKGNSDLTFDIRHSILWSSLEPLVGCICACLPCMGPVLQHRGLTTLINSVRSVFSLRSRSSKASSHREHPQGGNGLRTQPSHEGYVLEQKEFSIKSSRVDSVGESKERLASP